MERERFCLLIVDDDPLVLSLLETAFSEKDYRLVTAPDGRSALAATADVRVDAALLDLRMPGMNGMELLAELKGRFPAAHLCMMTGHGGVPEAVEAIRNGATDFLVKPLTLESLTARVAQFHEIWKLHRENEELRSTQSFRFGFDSLVGNSPPMLALKSLITRAAPSDTAVLLLGETGCGKELVARALHQVGPRGARPFVTVDCTSIAESLLESEVFGHVKGAFTGAQAAHPGLVRAADGGTVFFDEMGELPLPMQAKLLRLLQEKEVRPVGSVKTIPVDVRVIAATNRDLQQEVRNGRFREDLFYRLNVLTVRVPPLRERYGDVPLLARYFIQKLGTGFTRPRDFSPAAMALLEGYHWPGNVRELENAVRRALVLGRDELVGPGDLPPELAPGAAAGAPDSLSGWEEEAIRQALSRTGGNRRQAAKILGIGEATLYRKLRKLLPGRADDLRRERDE